MASGTTAERHLGRTRHRLTVADSVRVLVGTLIGIAFVATSAAATARPAAVPGERLPNGEPVPDRTSSAVGGIAARIHRADGEPVAGDVFLLMGAPGSPASARVYDDTPYVRPGGAADSETVRSNLAAHVIAEHLTGREIARTDMTDAPSGGPSGGLAYVLAYLNTATGGRFTNDLRVAATGRLSERGYVHPVQAVTEKTVAASLAGVAVMFTPSTPEDRVIAAHVVRSVGTTHRARDTGAALSEERRWDDYLEWGRTRPDGGIDLVHVRHVGDVAAYLCGGGSSAGCAALGTLTTIDPDQLGRPRHGRTFPIDPAGPAPQPGSVR